MRPHCRQAWTRPERTRFEARPPGRGLKLRAPSEGHMNLKKNQWFFFFEQKGAEAAEVHATR